MPDTLTTRPRTLRRVMTEAEKKLWTALRGRRFAEWDIRRQVPVGPYIVDFLCKQAGLVIEVDGSQHADSPTDAVRDAWLAAQGFRVLRIWNYRVFQEWDDVLGAIWHALEEGHPSSAPSGHDPSPLAGEGAPKGRMRAPSVPPWLTLVGLGEDGLAGLSSNVRAALDAADILVGGARHLALVGDGPAERWVWPSPMSGLYGDILAARGRNVVVLATGDPFHHGVGSVLAGLVDPAEMRVLPGASAFSLAAARLGWAVQACVTLSLHGRAFANVTPHIRSGRRLLLLSWDGATPGRLARHLVAFGYGPSRLVVLEAMGGPRERITEATADTLEPGGIDPLNTVAVEVRPGPGARRQPLGFGLPDDLFEHDGQITRRDIRALTLSALAPMGGELLWDIGGGSGSVGIEWMLADPANRTVAVERDPTRAARIARNAESLGVPGLVTVEGVAPDVLADLPRPDAAFVGGGTSDAALLDAVWDALPAGGRLVANAVTLEGEMELARRHGRHGGDLARIHIERAGDLGRFRGFAPARAVTQWRGVKP